MKKLSTKHALLFSALAMLVCVSMLIGSTFAWFTDTASTGVNTIYSGNLDVKLTHTNESVTDQEVTANTLLFDDVDLWEPGAMSWEKLTVENAGTLALKYKMTMNVENATKTTAGKTLTDVLQVALLDAEPTRDSIKNASLTALKDFALNATDKALEKGETDDFYIAIYWKPTANDNDYNVAGGLSIDLGVTLVAAQDTVESDSFDNQYDKDATYDGSTYPPADVELPAPSNNAAANGEALANAINDSASDKDGDGEIELKLPAGEYKMPSISGDKTVAIVGTKETVIDNTMGSYQDSANLSFYGVTIKGSTGKANGNGSDYAALYSPNVTYTDCTFDGPFRVGRDGAKFINCTFNNLGNDYVWVYGNDCEFIGCTFNTDGKAILLYSDGPNTGDQISTVTVKNCTFNATQSAKAGAISNQSCAAIEIHNYGNGVDLTTSGNTIDSDFSGEWRIKTYEIGKPGVKVNGVEYKQIALDGKLMTINGTEVTVNP